MPLKRSNSVVKSRLGVPMGAVTESCDLCLLPLIVKLNKKIYFFRRTSKNMEIQGTLWVQISGWSFGQFLGLMGHLLTLEMRKEMIVLTFSPTLC